MLREDPDRIHLIGDFSERPFEGTGLEPEINGGSFLTVSDFCLDQWVTC